MGEDITETLEVIPRQWKVIQTVREKLPGLRPFTPQRVRWTLCRFADRRSPCRACEKISQPPAPFHPTPRGWAGPNLLAFAIGLERMATNGSLLFEKFGQHQPLNRQVERYAKEGVEVSLSTLADQVGACTVALEPIHALIRAHVLAAERLHGPSRQIASQSPAGQRTTPRCRSWPGAARRPRGSGPMSATTGPSRAVRRRPRSTIVLGPMAEMVSLYVSRDREMAHPNRHLAGWRGILQAPSHGLQANHCRAADAYGGYNDLYRGDRDPGPAGSALCWSHARRKFFELADIKGNVRKGKSAHDISPVALEAVARIDAIFDIERRINGLDATFRLEARHRLSCPLVEALHAWLRAEQGTMSKHNPVAKAINYMFKKDRWVAFTRFLENGRVCLTNNAAERALRGVALGRKSWLFAGSERGGDRAAFMYSLIVTAKMNDVDPQAWLGDVLARLPGTTASRVPDLLHWNWSPTRQRIAA